MQRDRKREESLFRFAVEFDVAIVELFDPVVRHRRAFVVGVLGVVGGLCSGSLSPCSGSADDLVLVGGRGVSRALAKSAYSLSCSMRR